MAATDAMEAEFSYLETGYGEFPVEDGTYEVSAKSFERVRDLDEMGIYGAARVWVQRDRETLLVRENSRPDSWGVAGGLVEPDEHADEAGRREVAEETGIECAIQDVAYVHVAEYRPDDRSDRIEQYGVAFIATYVGGSIEKQDSEIAEVNWFENPPDTAHPPVSRIGRDRLGWDIESSPP